MVQQKAESVSGIRIPVLEIRIRIIRIRMFLGLKDLDPLVRGTDPDPVTEERIRIRTKMSRIRNTAGFTEPGLWIPQRTLFFPAFSAQSKDSKKKSTHNCGFFSFVLTAFSTIYPFTDIVEKPAETQTVSSLAS
jgi:hypothetical protein